MPFECIITWSLPEIPMKLEVTVFMLVLFPLKMYPYQPGGTFFQVDLFFWRCVRWSTTTFHWNIFMLGVIFCEDVSISASLFIFQESFPVKVYLMPFLIGLDKSGYQVNVFLIPP